MLFVLTGATGHIGNNIARLLLEQGHSVRVLLRRENDVAIDGLELQKAVGDLCDMQFLLDNIESGCAVIHSAGVIAITEKNKDEVYHGNVDTTCCIAEACLKKGARLVFVSSVDAICGEGKIYEPERFYPDELVGSYAKSKAIAGNYVLDKVKEGLDGCIVCPSAVIGDNDFKVSCVGQVIKDHIDSMPLAYVSGGYNFVSVTDVARGCVLAAQKGKAGKCYLLTGEYISVKDMFLYLNKLSGKKHLPPYLPIWLVGMLSPIVSLYYTARGKKPVFSKYALNCLTQDRDYCADKTVQELGYEFRSAKESIKESYDYFINANK